MSATHFSGPIYSGTGVITGAPVVVTDSTLTVSADVHGGNTTMLNRAAGQTVTLPAASGSGVEYKFVIGITVGSNTTTIKVANALDFFIGRAFSVTDTGGACIGFIPANSGTVATNSDTITLNGGTKGGLIGDTIIVKDVASTSTTGVWQVSIFSSTVGSSVTPFSAGV